MYDEPLGDEMPTPEVRRFRIDFSSRSHRLRSYNFPVNIGVGNSMIICRALSSAGAANGLEKFIGPLNASLRLRPAHDRRASPMLLNTMAFELFRRRENYLFVGVRLRVCSNFLQR